MTAFCFYPDDDDDDFIIDVTQPKLIFIYGETVHLPDTINDYDLEVY